MLVVGFDTETDLIGPYNVIPSMVCLACSCQEDTSLFVDADATSLDATIEMLLTTKDWRLVAHNAAFDLAVIARRRPELFPVIFEALEDGRVSDTLIREKLILLATTGDLENLEVGPGVSIKLRYGLEHLVLRYFGEDISASKKQEDSWRLNYKELSGVPLSQWPQDAIDYAIQDAQWAEKLWHVQEERRERLMADGRPDPFKTEAFQVAVDFCLQLMAAQGIRVDAQELAKVEAMLEEELSVENLNLLYASGILRPAEPPRPYANGAKDHRKTCPGGDCDCPPKMTKGTKESENKTKLRELVEQMAKDNPEIEIKRTAPTEKFPEGQISVDAEFLERYSHLNPVLEQYHTRQKVLKLRDTYIPAIKNPDGSPAERVWTNFNVIVSTGRTSSYNSELYPSQNFQNVDRRIRPCYIADPGNALFSIDYSALELGTLAQKCLDLFGFSVLATLINDGEDPHAYLGAQIARATDEWFRSECANAEPEQVYRVFKGFKKSEDERLRKFFKHYRTLAKPTGLGYPGGLGPKTFTVYAKATFGVEVDYQTANQLRELWRETFPEMPRYHAWVNEQKDPHNGKKLLKEGDGDTVEIDLYHYTSPMGMYRAGCQYCAVANGAALQTPSAEGAKLAIFNVVRACYDPTLGSILYPDDRGAPVRPLAFIHDELFGHVRLDEMTHERMMETSRIMVEAMKIITPDVTPRVEPALMLRWSKDAEPVYDENGRLTVWEPSQ